MVTLQNVKDLFDRYGWAYQETDEATLVTGFKGETRAFVIGARLHADWLTLTIPRFLPPIPPERRSEIFSELLQLNSEMSLVRFSLGSDADIILTADLPGHKRFDYDLFAITLDLLSLYANDCHVRLHKLITGMEPQPKAAEGKAP